MECVVNGRTLAFERRGAGPPIVLINGFAATRLDWDPTFLAALAEKHELVLLDNRGVGDSPPDAQPFTVDDLAEDVAGVLAEAGLERPAVLGWSMGGFIAQTLAAAQPDRVSALVLLSTRAAGDTSAPVTAEARARLFDFSGTPREQARRLISLLFPPEQAREIDEEFGEVVAAARAALPMETVLAQEQVLKDWAHREPNLSSITCPTLVATGAEDEVIPPRNAANLAAGIDGAWLARFPRSGHGFMADHPLALGALVASFLAANTP
jgi:pimeloyl-ACP methyl ester carboxylesterase